MRIVVKGLVRSLAPIGGVGVLTLIIMYIYAIIGWALFGEALPQRWGTAGEAMLSVFEVLTLEGWNTILAETREVTGWAVLYLVSFIVVATFVVLNIVIALVINSVEEARRSVLEDDVTAITGDRQEATDLLDRIQALRASLDELERDLTSHRPAAPHDDRGHGRAAGSR